MDQSQGNELQDQLGVYVQLPRDINTIRPPTEHFGPSSDPFTHSNLIVVSMMFWVS